MQVGPVIAAARLPCAVGAHSITHVALLPKPSPIASTAPADCSRALVSQPHDTLGSRWSPAFTALPETDRLQSPETGSFCVKLMLVFDSQLSQLSGRFSSNEGLSQTFL